ncbi:MAG: 50S ribosomal protein L7/L12 [Aeriscardovia sp.]|nr:50S ribosomal protein L7/L12 [Aeriscardovia sp.]MBQ9687681.1 50S ribosomal protein L7/L12 [Aeriscardovia sp.]MBR2556693.1 50S ribosomal protein L7/L12 [Aeriscardovia sp.]MBR3359540.1 50S ribosomal protein L7/L12 [Aeriscardovia sp.]MBR4414558.1 50S ribosomal protein L7/L12 [Aeriscardovia sp.]
MAKLSTDELLDAFKDMTLVELNEFVKAFEDEFDVKASAPVAVAAAPAAGAAAAEDEKTEFDVVITSVGDKKIQVIKAIREITKKGLAESKALADKMPSTILEGASKDDAEKAKKALEDAGASVDLK